MKTWLDLTCVTFRSVDVIKWPPSAACVCVEQGPPNVRPADAGTLGGRDPLASGLRPLSVGRYLASGYVDIVVSFLSARFNAFVGGQREGSPGRQPYLNHLWRMTQMYRNDRGITSTLWQSIIQRHLSVCASPCISVSLSLPLSLSLFLSLSLSVCLSFSLGQTLAVPLSMSLCLPLPLSLCFCVCLSPSLSLSLSLWFILPLPRFPLTPKWTLCYVR